MSFSWHRTTMFQTLDHDPLVGLKVNIIGQDWHFKNEIQERKNDGTAPRAQPAQHRITQAAQQNKPEKIQCE